MTGDRFYEEAGSDARRSAPAVLRNREPIAKLLGDWLPKRGLVLELASGTGEHALYFAERFPDLEWQPSDIDADALRSIRAWVEAAGLPNLKPPLVIDAAQPPWPIERADAVLSINMVHISPWEAALGLINGAARLLQPGSSMILYGPWVSDAFPTAPSNIAFDADLRRRNPEWGLRTVEAFAAEAADRDFEVAEKRRMPANNLMLRFARKR